MDRARRYRPKSIRLVWLIEVHAGALECDWRTRFGLSLSDLRSIGWVDAWRLTSEILRDPFSHTSSAIRGDVYVPNPSEASVYLLIDWLTASLRGKNQVNSGPAKRPWEGKPAHESKADNLTPEQREKRRALVAFAHEQAAASS